MKAIILNDTAKNGGVTGGLHFGCQLVMETIHEQCERVGIDIIDTVGAGEPVTVHPDTELVIVNGEGSLHHDRRTELLEIARHHPSVLINSVWQNNNYYNTQKLRQFKLVMFRESLSAQAAGLGGVVPDLCFASRRLREWQKPSPTEDIGITDSVLNQGQGVGFSAIQDADSYLTELCKYQRVVCGRFHAAVACAVLGIPFSTWPSNTHKMEGLMEDMGLMRYHWPKQEYSEAHCPVALDERVTEYCDNAYQEIKWMFDEIKGVA